MLEEYVVTLDSESDLTILTVVAESQSEAETIAQSVVFRSAAEVEAETPCPEGTAGIKAISYFPK